MVNLEDFSSKLRTKTTYFVYDQSLCNYFNAVGSSDLNDMKHDGASINLKSKEQNRVYRNSEHQLSACHLLFIFQKFEFD